MSIIMRTTLHDHAPNTYYGQWPGGKGGVFRASIHGPMTKATLRRRGIARPLGCMFANIQGITRLGAANFEVREKEKENRLV